MLMRMLILVGLNTSWHTHPSARTGGSTGESDASSGGTVPGLDRFGPLSDAKPQTYPSRIPD